VAVRPFLPPRRTRLAALLTRVRHIAGMACAPASCAPASCDACGKSGKLLRCGQCKNAWFCNRECQIFARKKLGHKGANCRRLADGAQTSFSSATAEAAHSPVAPPQPSTAVSQDAAFHKLLFDARELYQHSTRLSYLAAVEKLKEAEAVAEHIGGADGCILHVDAGLLHSDSLVCLGDLAAATRAACDTTRAARASGNIARLIQALVACGTVAEDAPEEMARAEERSLEQERLRGFAPSFGGMDLSKQGWICLPTTPAALSRFCIRYGEAAVFICDAALAACGGRDSPGPGKADELRVAADVRRYLAVCLFKRGEDRQRGLKVMREAVELLRHVMRMVAPDIDAREDKRKLACQLDNLGNMLIQGEHGSEPEIMAEVEACTREALELSESLEDVQLKINILRSLVNLCGQPHATVGRAEAEALRSRLNRLYSQKGRTHDTSCTICLEPLEQPSAAAGEGDGGDGAVGDADSYVGVLKCGHQFHRGCLSTWWHTTANRVNPDYNSYACPLCKK